MSTATVAPLEDQSPVAVDGIPPVALIDGLPPGSNLPMSMQTLAMRTRQRPYLERSRRRYGSMFTISVIGLGPTVIVSDPELIKQTFRADPTVPDAGRPTPPRKGRA